MYKKSPSISIGEVFSKFETEMLSDGQEVSDSVKVYGEMSDAKVSRIKTGNMDEFFILLSRKIMIYIEEIPFRK